MQDATTDRAAVAPASRAPDRGAPARTIGLIGATGVGIGAIVGGGIIVLAGIAFRAAGPSAIVAIVLNAVLALLTALSFAEMSTAFPESGGAYTFAKKVLNVRAAFAVGWILWFAYIVAGVLYALGFASYAVEVVKTFWKATGSLPPPWLETRSAVVGAALAATAAYTVSLIRKATGGAEWATWGKVVVFSVLIVVGFWALASRDLPLADPMTPFFTGGAVGVLQAMGFTFIAVQGFELIATVAGEIKDPSHTIPRSMKLSLAAGVGIYLPLLFVVMTAGVPSGESITEMSERDAATVMATAVDNYMGPVGYWLVVVAAVLSTLSALHANLLAASRVALTMARDRTLPTVLGGLHAERRTPVMALYASALALAAILLMVPDVAAAGAAASLIFLVAFALAHWTSYLARRRITEQSSLLPAAPEGGPVRTYQTPFFPLVPAVGGFGCAAMAVFQAFAVPAAGAITAVWLGLGVLLYFALFSSRAQAFDAFAEAQDPALVRLRGRSPQVLVPIANPKNAAAMVGVASALAPPRVGRVMLFSVIRPPESEDAGELPTTVEGTQVVLREAIVASFHAGHKPEALMTVAPAPWKEIGRVVRTHHCEGLLLGLAEGVDKKRGEDLEALLNSVDCDVTFMRAPEGWSLSGVRRILVPVGGRGGHFELRARLLGTLARDTSRITTWMTVLPPDASVPRQAEARRMLENLAHDRTQGAVETEVALSRDAADAIIARSKEHDVVILGLQRAPDGRRLFGAFALRVASEARCAVLLISRGA